METTTDTPVCGLVDPELVSQVLGTAEVSTTGDGAVDREVRLTAPASCSIKPADASQPVIQVRIGEVVDGADYWRKKLDQEAAKAGCELQYTDDPGYGYACDYTTGMYNPGSSVDVLRGDRIIRVVIYKWSGSTHEQRVKIAEEIVRDADKNLTAFDNSSKS
ncbi:hypothetical protein [Aeromicrobium sp. UC242_57]|uniref:hypothetical protein n=1 Tax=Aeromicrobium sp. UC242_57 TaxID=3374624 RepID=UPI0037B843B2